MDIIHDARIYTRHQNNLMEAVVGCVWGNSRTDIKCATNEITENIEILRELAPSTVCIPEQSKEALYVYGTVKLGLLEDVSKTNKGYELFAIWLHALYEYAYHTKQLPEKAFVAAKTFTM